VRNIFAEINQISLCSNKESNFKSTKNLWLVVYNAIN